jgi:hypothetical protein
MDGYISSKELLSRNSDDFLASVSIDCIIIGFNEGEVKILLSRFKSHDDWMLPGGFVFKTESLDEAAYRILHYRAKLKDCYLRQFNAFGNPDRTNIEENRQLLIEQGIDPIASHWFLKRFISIGYYVFVNYDQVKEISNIDQQSQWFSLAKLPVLYSDHNAIVEKAIQSLRSEIWCIPIGLDLLPEKFPISELRIVYETILGRKIDRRNFQRKILSYGLIYKLDEVSKKRGIKETTLFSFNKEKYAYALKNGFSFF